MVRSYLLVVLASGGGDIPLMDLDWTVLVQAALFLLMLAFLTRVLFRPFLRLRNLREENIQGARQRARKMEDDARVRVAAYEAEIERAKARGSQERSKIHAEADQLERQVLESTRSEMHNLLVESRTRLASERSNAQAALGAQVEDLAGRVLARVLGREARR
jgi:F-type H+-transporting ATPase subunit b